MKIEPVTEGELSILEVIWEQGAPTSRDIAAANGRDTTMTTERQFARAAFWP